MADSWEDMSGSTDIFTIGADWQTVPTQALEPFRTIIQYPGTGVKIRKITDNVQIKFTIHFGNMSKADEYALLSFFDLHRGRAKSFWLPIPKNYWTLDMDTLIGYPHYLVLKNSDPQWLRGYERMFLLLKNGDYIGREIYNITTVSTPGQPNLMTVVTALDRVVKVMDVELFGKLILCRFDQDEIELQHVSTALSDCDLSFQELPLEYPSIGLS